MVSFAILNLIFSENLFLNIQKNKTIFRPLVVLICAIIAVDQVNTVCFDSFLTYSNLCFLSKQHAEIVLTEDVSVSETKVAW